MQEFRVLVGPSEQGMRLDRCLVSHLPQTWSRAAVQKLIEAGGVTIEDRPVKAHQVLRAGQVIVARFGSPAPAPKQADETPQPIPLTIVHEDEHLLVVNKPPGLVTHPAPGHWSGTLVNALLWHLREPPVDAAAAAEADAAGVFEEADADDIEALEAPESGALPRAGIVHRLDRDTSGLLLVAKTDQALRLLSRQLADRTMSRRYLAIVEGHVPMNAGTVTAAIGRHAKYRKIMAVRLLDGRHAVTHYRVLARIFPRTSDEFPYTILDVALETGRTHQVRVHVAHLGYPILGDTVYGKHPASFWQRHGVGRQLLHAYQIRFRHPAGGHPVHLRAPIPDDMIRWIPTDVLDAIGR